MYLAVKSLLQEVVGQEIVLEKPRSRELGHFAVPTFAFAKVLKKPPKLIAEELARQISHSQKLQGVFAQVNAVNGYVNCFIKYEFLLKECRKILQNGFVSHKTTPREKILLEYVSANPTGPLHIGHARGAIFGDCLMRLGSFLGYEMVSEYYINDAGNQIHLLGLSILSKAREILAKESGEAVLEYPKECYQGEYISELAREAISTFGKQEASSESSVETLADFGKDKMLQEIKENLAQVGIYFDNFVSEKSLYTHFEEIKDKLIKSGGVAERDGKLWLLSSQKNDEKDRVIVRENGEPTYLAGDIIYHYDKFNRPYDRYINIWGADHHGYIARVKAALEFLGYDSSRLEILLSQMVSLLQDGQPYKMSKRAGNFILMKEIVNEIGPDALRLVFLSKKPDTHLEFDIEVLGREDASNPVYYIQYAHARIHTLLKKAHFSLDAITQEGDTPTQAGQREIDLLVLALSLVQVAQEAFLQRAPQKMVEFLRDLSAEFHRFYNEERIIGNSREREILLVLLVVAHSLKSGLALLGVEAKESMSRE